MLISARFLGLTVAFLGCLGLVVTACDEDEAVVRTRPDGSASELDGASTPTDGGNGALACGVTPAPVYVAPSFAANAAAEIALATNLLALDAKMASTEGSSPATATVTAADLAALYNAGAPSLRTVATSSSQANVDVYLAAFGAAQGKTWEPADATADAGADAGAPTGGKYKSLFYESPVGIDLRAATVKTIYGGSLYNWALTILAQPVNDASVDRLLALYGASTALANRTDVEAGADGDRFVAELASKRDDKSQPDPGGLYRKMKTTILRMKAATSKLPDCQADLTTEIGNFRLYWEQATLASAIYSLNAAASSAVDPAKGALTLHSYGDALGLLQGFKGIPADKRKINDDQIVTVLNQLGADSPYKLVTDPGTQVQALTGAIANIALFEAFDAASVESFKKSF